MPLTFAQWFGNQPSLVATQFQTRAAIQWARIQDKATDVEFVKPSTLSKDTPPGTKPAGIVLPTQTVRIEFDSRASIARGVAGSSPVLQATIFGIRGHPDIDDTDMDEGYTFEYEGDSFRIIDIIRVIGGVQAIAVVNG